MQRNTVQRQIILDALGKLGTHPTVEEIYAAVQKEHPTISKSTVYRNLRGLAQSGMILQISLPDSAERYDGNNHPHYHFKCRGCGCILDVEIDHLDHLNTLIQSKYGFEIDRHDVVFTGACIDCLPKN